MLGVKTVCSGRSERSSAAGAKTGNKSFYIFKSGKRTLRSSRRRIESNHNKEIQEKRIEFLQTLALRDGSFGDF